MGRNEETDGRTDGRTEIGVIRDSRLSASNIYICIYIIYLYGEQGKIAHNITVKTPNDKIVHRQIIILI